MSAFIVEDKTINQIVNFIEKESWQKDGLTYGMLDRMLKKEGYDLTHPDEDKRLAEDLFIMNCRAINQRYGVGEAAKFRPMDFRFDASESAGNYQVYKSLGCLIYQCSEGRVPDEPLYKLLVKVKRIMAECLIDRIPEYKKAIWN